MKVPFLDLVKQYRTIQQEMDSSMQSVLDSGAFIGGPFVKKFEAEFADYCATQFCLGVGNGTDALEIALKAFDFPPGSEVILPANTYFATAEAVSNSQLVPVFCDVDEKTYTCLPESVESLVSSRTKAIIAVHLYGQPCEMDTIQAIATRHDLMIVEDCAQAHGALYKGRRVGSIGNIGCFSFYPGKNLGAYGDGGAITSDDGDLIARCRLIANHGKASKFDHQVVGRNSRLDGIQAAVLSTKLTQLDKWNETRLSTARTYIELLRNVEGIVIPTIGDNLTHVFHLFVIRSEKRDELGEFLKSKEVATGIHYPLAIPETEAYRDADQDTSGFFACNMGGTLISLPMGDHMNASMAEYVSDCIKEFYS